MAVQGYAELLLHDGHVPPHLLYYMKRLGKAIAMYIVDEFGPQTIVKRLADPLWFQAFNNIIGMDWDSSGSTTVVLYVLKSFANVDTLESTGFAILGGKGADSRRVKEEVEAIARHGLDPENLLYISRLSAKIDSTALQDGYSLYIHGLVVSEDGAWTVIQQGMNIESKLARRYHIHSATVTAEMDPHSGIACNTVSRVLNLLDQQSSRARKTIVDIALRPREALRDIIAVNRALKKDETLTQWLRKTSSDRYVNPANISTLVKANPLFYRPVTDINRIEHVLNSLTNYTINTFDDLLILRNVGPEVVRALALVADVIYGDRPSFKDPVTHAIDPFAYSFAHGGKDGIPFPVRYDIMRETIQFLEDAINNARIEYKLKRRALENLYRYWRRLQEASSHIHLYIDT